MAETRLSPTASLTVATLVKSILRQAADTPLEDVHTNAPTASGTSLTVADSAIYEVGDVLEWRDDASNDLAIVTALPNATTLTVRRDYLFVTGAAHLANAKFTKWGGYLCRNVEKAVQDSLDSDLYPDLFAVYVSDIAPAPTTTIHYSVTADMQEVLDIYQKSTNTPSENVHLSLVQPEYVDTTLSATGKALKLKTFAHPTQTVFVVYRRIPAVGDLSAAMGRVVEYGAMARLLDWKVIEKLPKGENVEQSGILAPGSIYRDARWFWGQQDAIKRQEKAVLLSRFPRLPRHYRPSRRRWRHYSERVR